MRAARYHGVRDIRIEELPDPTPEAGEVLVKVAHNGICGSDLHEYYSAPTFIPVDPHPLTGAHVPVVLGHEFSGTVVEVGDGVDPDLVGTNAALRPTYSCGQCASCQRGLHNICRRLAFHGLSAHGGGLAELTTLPADHVHPLPDSVSLELGALVEPMAVGSRRCVASRSSATTSSWSSAAARSGSACGSPSSPWGTTGCSSARPHRSGGRR